jgi:tetratricopeptide (TPR) repeat protein
MAVGWRRGWAGSNLERQYDRHRVRAERLSIEGQHAQALRESEVALAISRRLHEQEPDNPRHLPVLAAALYNHAGRVLRSGDHAHALALLDEALDRYAALAGDDPAQYEVRRIDVLLRQGGAMRQAGDRIGAIARFREVIQRYPAAPANDPVERGLGLARAHVSLGTCLQEEGETEEALGAFDSALFTAERVREEAGISPLEFNWLERAPRSFQLAAGDWLIAATRAMDLHARAGRWHIAADAANIAVRVSAGLAAMDDSVHGPVFQATLQRAQAVWEVARRLNGA